MGEDLNSWLPRTNPASGQGGTGTRGILISSPALKPLGYAASSLVLHATFLQNELNSDVARYTTHIKPVLQQIRLLTGLNVAGKTRTIAFELVLQQKLQNKLHLFVARFTEALAVRAKIVLQLLFFSGFKTAY